MTDQDAISSGEDQQTDRSTQSTAYKMCKAVPFSIAMGIVTAINFIVIPPTIDPSPSLNPLYPSLLICFVAFLLEYLRIESKMADTTPRDSKSQ